MVDDFLRQRLIKLLALSERGIGGEKENAQTMLKKLLVKHNVTLDDLKDDRQELFFFGYKTLFERRLVSQIHAMITGDRSGRYYKYPGTQEIGLKITKLQYLEIDMLYSIYRKSLKEEMEILYGAFIQRNHIFSMNGESKSIDDLDPKERERLRRILQMSFNLPVTEVRKALKA